MDKDDLRALCEGATAEDVDQLHRLLHQWTVGPENSYPVQLALLTRSQWRAAASIPRSVIDSRKGLELHLAEYRKQTAALISNLERVGQEQVAALREIVDAHGLVVQKTQQRIDQRDARLEAVASHIKSNLESAQASWKLARAEFDTERQKLEQARTDLDSRQNWRDWLAFGGLVLTVLMLGISVGLLLRK